jgi:hypothetical protein
MARKTNVSATVGEVSAAQSVFVQTLQGQIETAGTAMKTVEAQIKELQDQMATHRQTINSAAGTLSVLGVKTPGVKVSGRRGSPTGKRPSNDHSLVETLVRVVGKSKAEAGVSVEDATAGALSAGYKSGAQNFGLIVNQTLIKSDLFKNVSRGHYALSAAGQKAYAA